MASNSHLEPAQVPFSTTPTQETITQYTDLWTRLMLFCWRVAQAEGEESDSDIDEEVEADAEPDGGRVFNAEFTTDQRVNLSRIENILADIEDPDNVDQTTLDELVIYFSISLI